MPPVKKRASNFTNEEERLLVSLVEENKNIVENKKSGHTSWQDKQNIWMKIESEFNARSRTNIFRDLEVLKQKYNNMKKVAKQKFSANKISLTQTGGGKGTTVDINDIDETIKDILGTQIEGLPSAFDNDMIIEQDFIISELSNEVISTDKDNCLLMMDYGTNQTISCVPHDGINVKENERKVDGDKTTETAKRNWSTYTSKMLKDPTSKKLKGCDENTSKIAYKKNINEKLIKEKLEFVKLQRELLLEEHAIKMQIYKNKINIQEKKLNTN